MKNQTNDIFSMNAQYLVRQGKYANFVFSPLKVSKCGSWAWIVQYDQATNTKEIRIHWKHVECINDKERHKGLPLLLPTAPARVAKPSKWWKWAKTFMLWATLLFVGVVIGTLTR